MYSKRINPVNKDLHAGGARELVLHKHVTTCVCDAGCKHERLRETQTHSSLRGFTRSRNPLDLDWNRPIRQGKRKDGGTEHEGGWCWQKCASKATTILILTWTRSLKTHIPVPPRITAICLFSRPVYEFKFLPVHSRWLDSTAVLALLYE